MAKSTATTEKKLDARGVMNALYARHPGSGGQMPGPWTVIEEYRAIDLLAFSAWQSAGDFDRVGYEVKVSRSDLRVELLNPHKRARNVAWCNEFYFAVPKGLLTPAEAVWEEPEWQPGDSTGQRCPGFNGRPCRAWRKQKTHYVTVPVPTTSRYHGRDESIVCPTCKGKGVTEMSRVEREAPRCWIPRDVGLVVIDGRGCRVVKPSPKRKEVPAMEARALSAFVRWISMRPDPRHAQSSARRNEYIADQLERAS